ncbi:lipid biosynthesis B12-binding/radical SAM protein [Desulfuromusa kysingii]|uniref:Lipid biosynthesis B12-binding/radical SAM protein n=1 Tax=Desulfuromusa kysingii TaxID=37625 RepID=A0A1H3VPH0_9BACT|nr:lipid biosynthesis B12-binding/radical SAM protein [Desulfuromusa kysingii]SDZ76670.1 lipid biosynthesis B12-binding/radical SAM protein [Desulfuromusa kysingii]
MSRVFFISSNTTTDPYPVYPLGMAVVAGAVKTAGHQVRQFDTLAQGESMPLLLQQIRDFAPDLLAISLRNIDNVDSFSGDDGWYLQKIRDFIVAIRKEVSAPIVVGGPALTILPEEIADYLAVDYAVIGEGERSLPQLVADLAAGKEVPRLIQRNHPLPGDEFSSPLFEQNLVNFYLQQSGMVNLQTKRGCPHRCSYCSYPHLEGYNFRFRSPQLVVDELEKMQREHGVERVFFTDSVFNDPQKRYLVLVEEMLRRNLKMQWSAFFRPQGLSRQELALMKRAGLYALELGTDAGSDQTLAGLDKRLTFAEIIEVNQACLDQQLPAAHFVMFGGPDEDDASVAEGMKNMAQLGQSVVFAFSGIRIHPDAPLHQRAIADGLVTSESSLLKPIYYFSPLLDRKKMEKTIEDEFAKHRNRIFPPSKGMERMAVMKGFGFCGLMWDRLVRFPQPGTVEESRQR